MNVMELGAIGELVCGTSGKIDLAHVVNPVGE